MYNLNLKCYVIHLTTKRMALALVTDHHPLTSLNEKSSLSQHEPHLSCQSLLAPAKCLD